MPIINLKVQGKQAIGDGTRIVCMNSDYKVQVECIDCDNFAVLPVKKLVIKAGPEYQESPLEEVSVDGQTVLQAALPLFDCQKSVELGVCGKQDETSLPVFTSKAAVFECDKSILCGAVVLKGDPKLESLTIAENGTYLAADKGVDGFYQVAVAVASAPSEVRTVELSMAGGSQLIEPSKSGRTMSQVIVTKPLSLIPENIRAGQSIGGVVGNYDKILTETEIYSDGEYTPPAGTDGFSRVIVNVGNSNYAKLLRVGDSFTYDYNTSVLVTIDAAGIIKYENDGNVIIFTAIGKGSCSVILKDLDEMGNIVNTVHYAIIVDMESDYMLPVEASTSQEMELYLQDGVAGGIVKYTGPTNNEFSRNALYIIEGSGGEQ
jgi:hypothetical protein